MLLSYYGSPSSIRQCFSYCAVFPKGYMHYEDDLLFLWMAHRFVELKSNVDIESTKAKKECITKDSGNWLDSDYTNARHLFLGRQLVATMSCITNPSLLYSDFCKKERMIKVSKYCLALLSMSTFDFGSTNLCVIHKNNNSSLECI